AVRPGVGGSKIDHVQPVLGMFLPPFGQQLEVLSPVEVGVAEQVEPAARSADGGVEEGDVVGECDERFARQREDEEDKAAPGDLGAELEKAFGREGDG